MVIRCAVLLLITLGLGACSGGGSGSPVPAGNSTGSGSASIPAEFPTGTIGPDAPTNAELLASEGIVTIEQANELIPGMWRYTSPSTQCVQTLSFSNDGLFVEVELDRQVIGSYEFQDDDEGLELSQQYFEFNGRVDCFGSSDGSTSPNVSYGTYPVFADRDTMTLFAWGTNFGFSREFIRQ